jgi:hypothetical protein
MLIRSIATVKSATIADGLTITIDNGWQDGGGGQRGGPSGGSRVW